MVVANGELVKFWTNQWVTCRDLRSTERLVIESLDQQLLIQLLVAGGRFEEISIATHRRVFQVLEHLRRTRWLAALAGTLWQVLRYIAHRRLLVAFGLVVLNRLAQVAAVRPAFPRSRNMDAFS